MRSKIIPTLRILLILKLSYLHKLACPAEISSLLPSHFSSMTSILGKFSQSDPWSRTDNRLRVGRNRISPRSFFTRVMTRIHHYFCNRQILVLRSKDLPLTRIFGQPGCVAAPVVLGTRLIRARMSPYRIWQNHPTFPITRTTGGVTRTIVMVSTVLWCGQHLA